MPLKLCQSRIVGQSEWNHLEMKKNKRTHKKGEEKKEESL